MIVFATASPVEDLGSTYTDSMPEFITIGTGLVLVFLVLGVFLSFIKGIR